MSTYTARRRLRLAALLLLVGVLSVAACYAAPLLSGVVVRAVFRR